MVTTLALVDKARHTKRFFKSWESSAPAYTIRAFTTFGLVEGGKATKDAMPGVTSKDVTGAVDYTLPSSPSFSLVSRCYIDETRDCTRSPGPQHYAQPKIVSNLHHPLYRMPPTKIFAGSERVTHVPSKVPGPGEYSINPNAYLVESPSYGFRLKAADNARTGLVPDSGCYNVIDVARTGKVWHGPSWTAVPRHDRQAITDKEDDLAMSLMLTEAPNVLGRRKIDTSGGSRLNPIPNWSFPKSKQF